jgi:hypothetical protein
MGVNGQKRKKKQGPVPSLEESLPKKFKSDKPAKSKKNENGVKTNGSGKLSKFVTKKDNSPKVDIEEVVIDERRATKASLFDDDDDDEPEEDEFEGLDKDVDM